MTDSERLIWEDFRNGEASAFTTLVQSTEGSVRGVFRGHPDEDDLVQETFVKIWLARKSFRFRTVAQSVSWARTIAKRHMIDHMRAQNRRPSLPVHVLPEVSDDFSGAHQMEARAAIRHLWRETLGLVSAQEATAAWLLLFEGRSAREVSVLSGINRHRVRFIRAQMGGLSPGMVP